MIICYDSSELDDCFRQVNEFDIGGIYGAVRWFRDRIKANVQGP